MNRAFALFSLIAMSVAGCSFFGGTGPLPSAVVAQATKKGDILFDVVNVDDRVVATLHAQPADSLAARLKKYVPPPQLAVEVGDRIVVIIWEAGPGGLFTAVAPQLIAPGERSQENPEQAPGEKPQANPQQAPEEGLQENPLQAPGERRQQNPEQAPGEIQQENPLQAPGERQQENPLQAPGEMQQENPLQAPGEIQQERGEALPLPGQNLAPAGEVRELQRQLRAEAAGLHGTVIPPQIVVRDGAITVPYAGRIPVLGKTAPEIEELIKQRLLGKALMPEILVLVAPGPANSVAVSGEGIRGQRVPLSQQGERLLQVIAAAGGARLPVRDLVVRLSRDGVTASIPYQRLVEEPTEDIYVRPGDTVTIARVPKTFTVLGASQLNFAFKINAPDFTLEEALAKAGGLNDATAAPGGVFLFRYEGDKVVRALGEPLATHASGGVSPVVYRFDLNDPKVYLLARRFPVRDKDIIFVAEASGLMLYRFLHALSYITGPVSQGYLLCVAGGC
jgi:protein involved in polysaccharide export with SLBB domain